MRLVILAGSLLTEGMTTMKGTIMDPDKSLSIMRQAILEWEKAPPGSKDEWEAAEDATGAAGALDAHLSSGGQLPRAWATAARATGMKVSRPDIGIGAPDSKAART
jgi:hypothetical protein